MSATDTSSSQSTSSSDSTSGQVTAGSKNQLDRLREKRAREHGTRECRYNRCETVYDPSEDDFTDHPWSHDYCTKRCRYRSIARGLLRGIKFDHRRCGCCFRELKDVIPPGRFVKNPEETDHIDPIPEAAIGEAEFHPLTLPAQGEVLAPRNAPYDWTIEPTGNFTGRRICPGCEGGSAIPTHHSTIHHDKSLTKEATSEYAQRIEAALIDRLERGKHHYTFSADVLFGALRKWKSERSMQGVEDRVLFEYALGLAVQFSNLKADNLVF